MLGPLSWNFLRGTRPKERALKLSRCSGCFLYESFASPPSKYVAPGGQAAFPSIPLALNNVLGTLWVLDK